MMTTRVEALLQGQLASVTSVGRRQIFQSVFKKKKKKLSVQPSFGFNGNCIWSQSRTFVLKSENGIF
jgi:hypothetical protein